MPDSTLSLALKEAYASVPSVVLYHTLELYHAAFTTPIRVKQGKGDILAVLEAGAPRDAGMQVTFLGFAFNIVPPEVTPSSAPQLKIEIDNVDRTIVTNVELSMESTTPISVIYRAYLETDLDHGPENDPPLEMSVISISATPFRVTAIAELINFNNKKFPGQTYTSTRFPGLIQ